MADFEGYKRQAEEQLSRAHRYANLNPEFWVAIYRALRRANTQWVSLGRVPGESFTAGDWSQVPPSPPRFSPTGVSHAEAPSSPYVDSGSTRTSATPLDSVPSSLLAPRARKRRAWKRQRKAQEEAPQTSINKATVGRSTSTRPAKAPKSQLQVNVRPPPQKLQQMPVGKKGKRPPIRKSAASNTRKTRKPATSQKAGTGLNHRPVTRSQARVAKAK